MRQNDNLKKFSNLHPENYSVTNFFILMPKLNSARVILCLKKVKLKIHHASEKKQTFFLHLSKPKFRVPFEG